MYKKIISLWRYLGWNKYIYIYIYIYSILDIFTMIFLGKWPVPWSGKLIITRVVIATGPGVQVFWVFTATFTLAEPTARLEQLLCYNISWGCGEPLVEKTNKQKTTTTTTTKNKQKKQLQQQTNKLLQWRYLVWNKPLITLRVIWLDISLLGFIFTGLSENKLACSGVKPQLQHTSASEVSGGTWEILSFKCLMAFPILTDRGRHWARKLRNKHQILCDMNQPNQLHADYSQRWKGEKRREGKH